MENNNKKNIGRASDQGSIEKIDNFGSKYVIGSIINDLDSNIKRCLKNITHQFFNIGYYLFNLKNSWSDDLTKKEFYSFCKENYSLSSTTVKNLICVYENFKDEENEEVIDNRFEDFSFSSLVELLPLKNEKEFASSLKKYSSNEIRKIVNSEKKLINSNYYGFRLLTNIYVMLYKKLKVDDFEVVLNSESKDFLKLNFTIMDLSFKLYLYFSDYNKNYSVHLSSVGDRSSFSFYDSFNKDEIESTFDKFIKKLKDYKCNVFDKKVDVNDKEFKKNVFHPTGAALSLNLKKKDIVPYAKNVSNYKKMIVSIPEIGIEIYRLEGCSYIFGIKEINSKYGDGFRVVGSNLHSLNSWSILELMTKEEIEVGDE